MVDGERILYIQHCINGFCLNSSNNLQDNFNTLNSLKKIDIIQLREFNKNLIPFKCSSLIVLNF